MNYHSRSYSEQPQMAQAGVNIANVSATNGNGPQTQSFIRIHSDSQQSLDQLFNPTQQNSVPLRNRNLPLSFFNPSVKNEVMEGQTNGQSNNNNNQDPSAARLTGLHHRSVSYDHQNQLAAAAASTPGANMMQNRRPNFHTRTHSTLAPMPRLLSNNSSHQSSHEFINQEVSSSHEPNFTTSRSTNLNTHQNLHHHSHSNSNWSSAANSTDNLNSPGWAASQTALNHDHLTTQTMSQVQHQEGAQAMMQQQQPPIMSPTHSHQNVFYTNTSNNSTPTAHVAQSTPTNQHACVHNRSMSFNPHPTEIHTAHHGFHARTHSTVAPMTNSAIATCNQHAVSNHSQELSYQSNSINSSSAARWTSSGYMTDDMTAGSSHGWVAGQVQQPALTSLQQPAPMHAAKPIQTDMHQHHHPHEHHMQAQPQHPQPHQPHQHSIFYHV